MQPTTILTIAMAATASANILRRQNATPEESYLIQVCYPGQAQAVTSGNLDDIDLTAPCNALANVVGGCVFGSWITGTEPSGYDTTADPAEFGLVTQRDCLCSSQFWSLTQGCLDCAHSHGFPVNAPGSDDPNLQFPSRSSLSSASVSYCATTNTPTVDILHIFDSVDPGSADRTNTASASVVTATFSDPLGSAATAVSYYYTPAVSGSEVAFVPEETILPASSWASLTLSISTNSAGLIVPTAATSTSGSLSAAATSTSGGAGVRVVQQAAGVVAFAGMVAML